MPIRLPAEWEPQAGVLIAWPHAATDWADTLDEVLPVYIELARAVSAREKLLIVTPEPSIVRQQLIQAGLELDNIRLAEIATNDTWCRDFGPLTLYRDSDPLLLDFGFNAWGLKFAADLDNQVTRRLHQQGFFGAVELTTEGLILEGGSLESDGQGSLLTTSRCLLSGNRNPQLNRQQLETQLCCRFGAERILWLEHGWLAGDDTDAHIDTLARLAPDDTIVHVACDDPDDEHFTELKAMADELSRLRTSKGEPYRLCPLPWPQPIIVQGRRLPATYANYLIINDAVLVPTYNDPADALALQIIGAAHPGRDVIGIEARPLIAQGGSLHCISMQIPQGALP